MAAITQPQDIGQAQGKLQWLSNHLRHDVRRTTACTQRRLKLHSADTRSWWKKTKQFLYSKHTNPLQNLQQRKPHLTLADEINDFFVSVSGHIPPFDHILLNSLSTDYTDQYIIEPAEVERQLLHINIHKSSGASIFRVIVLAQRNSHTINFISQLSV